MMNRWVVASVVAVALGLGAEAQEDAKGPIPIEVPKRHKPVAESPKTILKGGETGPAVIPGKSGESLLLLTAAHKKKPQMPPRKNKVGAGALTPQQLGLLKLWIDEGAKESLAPEAEAPHWRPVTSAWHPIYAVGLDTDGQYAACGRANQLFIYHVPPARSSRPPSPPDIPASPTATRSSPWPSAPTAVSSPPAATAPSASGNAS